MSPHFASPILQNAQNRAHLFQTVRKFFVNRGFLELFPPILNSSVVPESSLSFFSTKRYHVGNKELYQRLFLLPSPELFIKNFLSDCLSQNSSPENLPSVFALSHSFRNQEEGPWHQTEFTMLEWYSMGQNYQDNQKLTEELLAFCSSEIEKYHPALLTKSQNFSFSTSTVKDFFQQHTGVDILLHSEPSSLKKACHGKGIDTKSLSSFEEIFHYIFVKQLEERLPYDPLFLIDWPKGIPITGKQKGSVYERWELYIRGVELANCFTEENSLSVLQGLWDKETQALKNQKNLNFNSITPQKWASLPLYSGVAMGLDRLYALLYNHTSLEQGCVFPQED